MSTPDGGVGTSIPLSRSQQNLYNGFRQDSTPDLYLISKSYQFHPLPLARFLNALDATIRRHPLQLCVLEAAQDGADYPQFSLRLRSHELVCVRSETRYETSEAADEFALTWSPGLTTTPLVRYIVQVDDDGAVSGLDVFTHHIVLDGGATAIIEADLARFLAGEGSSERISIADGLARLIDAHQCEEAKVAESHARLAAVVQREMIDEAQLNAHTASAGAPLSAAKGVLRESSTIAGSEFEAISTLAEAENIPLNIFVAAAAVAVDASRRHSTEALLVHAVDNRFGNPALNVATCVVNSVAHVARFPAFASVQEVVRLLDRAYVKAVRRRWLREESYRRMYLAINRTTHIDALALNFIRETCAPALKPFLTQPPVATAIGPVEGPTVACVLDEERRTLDIAIWDRADNTQRETPAGVADRIVASLTAMPARWHQPLASTVGEWLAVERDGTARSRPDIGGVEPSTARSWFTSSANVVPGVLERRPGIRNWVAWLVSRRVATGDILVLGDDGSEKTIDLLIACHLAGCGYSVCDAEEQIPLRATVIAEHFETVHVHPLTAEMTAAPIADDDQLGPVVDKRLEHVRQDALLAEKIAYVMPTSGSTGQPKLVPVSHGSLAVLCDAVGRAYGWNQHDTILQCAPLTSDISVEEIFGGAACGSRVVRSTATRLGDLRALGHDILTTESTVVDLPTALWHLLCDDKETLDVLGVSELRQIVVGGEAIRPGAIARWFDSACAQRVSVLSTYGPTETTVVVTQLPVDYAENGDAAQLRLGQPMVADSVYVAFGEVVILGELVSTGYLGLDDRNFGTVTTSTGVRLPAFATADRVVLDADGHPIFAGRRDAIVKVSGKRVDIADVVQQVAKDPGIADVAVELRDGSLGVWFESRQTRRGDEDAAAAARIRGTLVKSHVPSFFVIGVPVIARKPNGKVDSARLEAVPQAAGTALNGGDLDEQATGLALVWSQRLGRVIHPNSSLLAEGVGSLDLIKILPDTRRLVQRHVSLLDLIAADSAANLVGDDTAAFGWKDVETAAEIERDLDEIGGRLPTARPPGGNRRRDSILVLGASGVLGTGIAQAALDLRQNADLDLEVVFVSRSPLPPHQVWSGLLDTKSVRIVESPKAYEAEALRDLINQTGPRAVVNCVGNTNVVVPYRTLRPANVELVSTIADVCAVTGTGLLHLSSYVVNADVAAPKVVDPRTAPYPYAASKAIAEIVVDARRPKLDFTLVRLPRVLGHADQLAGSTDILVSLVDACAALDAYPSVVLTEQVTTGAAVGHAILTELPALSTTFDLGRGITVACGDRIPYAEFLGRFAAEELDIAEWKSRLDHSDWALDSPRRWSVVDAWVALGLRLAGRSYSEYLAAHPTISLAADASRELIAKPQPLDQLLSDSLPGVNVFAAQSRNSP